MHDAEPSLDALEALATSSDVRDRAFAAGALSLRPRRDEAARLRAIEALLRGTADREHALTRRRLRERTLDGAALLAHVARAPADARDHLIEEILGIAYTGLEAAPAREVIGYFPSGLTEILFMLEHAALTPGKTFVDLGSGLGKVALLVALLTGARAIGIESNRALAERAVAAAQALALADVTFVEGDLHEAPIPAADVYYMFIPAPRAADALARLEPIAHARSLLLFTERLDAARFPWLRSLDASSYWLEGYAGAVQ